MHMKRIFQYMTSFALAAGLCGCEGFFDINNKQTLSPSNFPATLEQVDLVLTSSYSGTHAIGTYAFYWLPMGIYLYDHTTDTYGSYDERSTSMDNYTDLSSRYITTPRE